MNAVRQIASAPKSQHHDEIDTADLTQEIEAPLADKFRRDEPTLSKIDFDELEIKLDF